MDLQINSKSHVPVHVQLEEQLKHLILTGRFEVGSRLPSIRTLAGYLRVNRNTVARVISDLEREGFVETRRGSGVYVVEPPVDAEVLRRQEVLERVMELAASRGVSVEELGYALLARSGVPAPEKVPVLFVECNSPEVERYAAELEEALPVIVEPVLVEDLPARLSGEKELPWRIVVTTFYHVQEVERWMEPLGIETVALLTEATLEGLNRLSDLPEDTYVGVVGNSRTCTDNLLRSLEGAGLDHLKFFEIEESAEGANLPNDAKVVVCGSVVAQRLPELDLPEDVEVIVQDRTLSKGGVEMLGRMLRSLPDPA